MNKNYFIKLRILSPAGAAFGNRTKCAAKLKTGAQGKPQESTLALSNYQIQLDFNDAYDNLVYKTNLQRVLKEKNEYEHKKKVTSVRFES